MRADAELVNMPMLAVTGRNWTGAHLDFAQAPDEYRPPTFMRTILSIALGKLTLLSSPR